MSPRAAVRVVGVALVMILVALLLLPLAGAGSDLRHGGESCRGYPTLIIQTVCAPMPSFRSFSVKIW